MYGREMAFALAACLWWSNGSFQGAYALFVGRLLVGVGVGMNSVVPAACLGEIAEQLPGASSVLELALASGNLLALFVDYLLDGAWRWMLGHQRSLV